jgi:hypothetical protein
MSEYIFSQGTAKTIIRANDYEKISGVDWTADYDGDIANVDMKINNNGERKHVNIELNKKDLEDLLNIQAVNKPLHKRLAKDFLASTKSFRKVRNNKKTNKRGRKRASRRRS